MSEAAPALRYDYEHRSDPHPVNSRVVRLGLYCTFSGLSQSPLCTLSLGCLQRRQRRKLTFGDTSSFCATQPSDESVHLQ